MKMPHELAPGESTFIGGKLYVRCADCHQIGRADKPIFGALHFCVPPEQRRFDHSGRHVTKSAKGDSDA